MNKTLIVRHSDVISLELRAERKVSVQLAGADALEVGRVMVVNDNHVPVWIADIERFEIQPGGLKSPVTIRLARVVFLEGHWGEVSKIIVRYDDPEPGKIVLVDAEKLMRIGEDIEFTDSPQGGALTPGQAKTRLAWTYGVPESQVKISIDL
ncbi:hypothetical protein [Ectopseudomonas mendocina]|uniref:hypothetical protein n=1 Tax=Ectopseudomonas mendocina TaxID=300 RepID=UPI003F04225A